MRERHPEEYPEQYYEEPGISLRELILVLARGKKTIALITATVLLVTLIGATIIPQIQIGTKGTIQTAVKLYFSGIELGQTPTGTNYDINEMKSAEILRNAIDDMDLGSKSIPIEKLNANISFQAVVPDAVAETLKNLEEIKSDEIKMETLENLDANSNVFIVKLNLVNDLGINEEEGRILLDNIVLEYKKQLVEKYGNDKVLADVFATELDLTDYDYIEAADILDGQLSRMETYVGNYMTQTDVHSTVTGMNPKDIASALASIRTVDMERIFTMIATYYITREPDKVVAIYQQLVEDKEKSAAQYEEEAYAVKSVIQNFKKDEQKIVLGDMGSEPVTLTSENQQYNEFVTQYVTAGTNAATARADAAYYRAEAERFAAATSISGSGTKKAKETAENIELLKEKLIYWTDVINDTAEDYNSQITYQQYMEQLLPARSYAALEGGTNYQMIAAAGALIGLLAGIFVILFRAYMKGELSDAKN